MKGQVVDLAPLDDRYRLVEQRGQRAEDAGLGLAAEAKKNDVVLGEDRVVDGRDHGSVISVNAGKGLLSAGDSTQKVFPHFIFD